MADKENQLEMFVLGACVGGLFVWAVSRHRPSTCRACGHPITELNPAMTGGIPPALKEMMDQGVRLGTVALQNGMIEVWKRTTSNWELLGVFQQWAGVAPPIDMQ